jgi:hypothetical protein
MSRPIIWVNDEECTTCGQPGRIDGGNYWLCVPCWCQVNSKKLDEVRVQHVREREAQNAALTERLTSGRQVKAEMGV